MLMTTVNISRDTGMPLRLAICVCITPCVLVALYELLLRVAETARDRSLAIECGPTPTPLDSVLDERREVCGGQLANLSNMAEPFANPANMHLGFDAQYSRGLIVSYPRSGNHLLRVIIEFLTKRRTT